MPTPAKPPQANFYPADATREEVDKWIAHAERRRARRGGRVLHGHPARAEPAADGRPLLRRVPEHAHRSRRLPARSGEAHDAADAQEVSSTCAPTRSSRTTTSRATWRGWSSTRRSSRRSARTRPTKTSGSATRPRSKRSSRSATMRRRRSSAMFSAELQGLENALPIDAKYRNPKLGALAPIRVVNVVFSGWRRQPRRPDRRVQSPERRPRHQGKGLEARDAEERAGGEVREGAPADRQRRAAGRRSRQRVIRRVLHAHPDARADARPRPAPGARERPGRAAGAQGHLFRDRRSQGGHLRPLGAAATRRQGRRFGGHRADDVHDVPGVDVPLDPLRHQRSARQRDRAATQLPARSAAGSSSIPTARSRSSTARSRTASRR